MQPSMTEWHRMTVTRALQSVALVAVLVTPRGDAAPGPDIDHRPRAPPGCADATAQERVALWWLPAAATVRAEGVPAAALVLQSPLDRSWHGDSQVRISYRVDTLPAGARIRVELDGEIASVSGFAPAATFDATLPAAPGPHLLSVEVFVGDEDDEVVAQVSSTFTVVADQLFEHDNLAHIEYSYLPMDVVCNGHMDVAWRHVCVSSLAPHSNTQVLLRFASWHDTSGSPEAMRGGVYGVPGEIPECRGERAHGQTRAKGEAEQDCVLIQVPRVNTARQLARRLMTGVRRVPVPPRRCNYCKWPRYPMRTAPPPAIVHRAPGMTKACGDWRRYRGCSWTVSSTARCVCRDTSRRWCVACGRVWPRGVRAT